SRREPVAAAGRAPASPARLPGHAGRRAAGATGPLARALAEPGARGRLADVGPDPRRRGPPAAAAARAPPAASRRLRGPLDRRAAARLRAAAPGPRRASVRLFGAAL